MTPTDKAVLNLILQYGNIDGEHHKQWCLDQIVRIITQSEEGYWAWRTEHAAGEDGPDTYVWDEGIAP